MAPYEGPFEIIAMEEPNVWLHSHKGQVFTVHIANLSRPRKEYLQTGQTVQSTRKRPYRQDSPQHEIQMQPTTVDRPSANTESAELNGQSGSTTLNQREEAVPDSPFAPRPPIKSPPKPALIKVQPQKQQSILK